MQELIHPAPGTSLIRIDDASTDAALKVRPDFPPRTQKGQDGILVPAGHIPPADLASAVLPPLVELVRLATEWPSNQVQPDARIGDYRFLVLVFKQASGIESFVQIWAEPDSELAMEVGPGDRADVSLQAFANHIRPTLGGRGFEIGGNAANFAKRLPVPTPDDAPRIAQELLGLLIDVLGYDGSVDLNYKLHQGTFLTQAFVTHGITRPVLQDLLKAWCIHASAAADDLVTLHARHGELDFLVQLHVPLKGKKEIYWEIHPHTTLSIPRERVDDLISEVNDSPYLLKVCAQQDSGDATIPVRFAYGINLAGGVPFTHIRLQLMEWIETVQRLWAHWKHPLLSHSAIESETPTGTLH